MPRKAVFANRPTMSDIKLFRIQGDAVEQLQGSSVAIEASLQDLIELHLEALLGVRFLAHEYQTGKTHGGRIDTLGIDENCSRWSVVAPQDHGEAYPGTHRTGRQRGGHGRPLCVAARRDRPRGSTPRRAARGWR
jgi:hypothetical protein